MLYGRLLNWFFLRRVLRRRRSTRLRKRSYDGRRSRTLQLQDELIVNPPCRYAQPGTRSISFGTPAGINGVSEMKAVNISSANKKPT